MLDSAKRTHTACAPTPTPGAGADLMFNRKKLDRERLEIYLVYLMLMYRPFTLLTGLLSAASALFLLTVDLLAGSVLLVSALLLLGLGSSFEVISHTAKAVAWLAVLLKRSE